MNSNMAAEQEKAVVEVELSVGGGWVGGGLRSLSTCTLVPHEASPCRLNLHHCQHLCHAWSEDSGHQSIDCQSALS